MSDLIEPVFLSLGASLSLSDFLSTLVSLNKEVFREDKSRIRITLSIAHEIPSLLPSAIPLKRPRLAPFTCKENFTNLTSYNKSWSIRKCKRTIPAKNPWWYPSFWPSFSPSSFPCEWLLLVRWLSWVFSQALFRILVIIIIITNHLHTFSSPSRYPSLFPTGNPSSRPMGYPLA